MSANPQLQSTLITILPGEIRDAIYFQLWRSCGLRQHIVWHRQDSDPHQAHFCRWSCTTKYQVEDELQKEIEVLRQQLHVPLGGDMYNTLCGRRLQSPWLNHWKCGEHAGNVHSDANEGFMTSGGHCWKKSRADRHDNPSQTPYMPMLRSCKLISSECLASIYESTTFVFTDLMALQMFVGYCEMPPAMKRLPKMALPPPALVQYTRDLELSLTPDFPRRIPCASSYPGSDRQQAFHDAYDFHWLRLDQFQNLRSIKIWVAARSMTPKFGGNQDFVSITQIGVDSLRKALSSFSIIDSLTLSTPLGEEIDPEDGYVEDLARPSIKIWKRGTGDRFHPFLWCISPGGLNDGLVHTSAAREVRLAYNAEAEMFVNQVRVSM